MQSDFTLSCCSTVDLPYTYLEQRNIPILFYTYTVDDVEYVDDMGRDPEALPQFYRLLASGKQPKTAGLSIGAYAEFFERQLQKGDLLHVAFTSGQSGSVFNAQAAAKLVREKYPEQLALHFHHTEDGVNYFISDEDSFWRVMNYVDSLTLDTTDDLAVIEATGKAFGNFQAQLGLALLNQKDKHYTEAYNGINMLIEQYPDNAIAYAARGGMEKEKGQLEAAEYDYAKAMELDADNADYVLNHLDLLILLKRRNEAYADLQRLMKMGYSKGQLLEFYNRLKKK